VSWGGLGRLAPRNVSGGPVGPTARWAPRQMLNAGMKRRRRPRALAYSDKLFAWVSEFLVTPLLMGPVFLISQGQFEEPARPWKSSGESRGKAPVEGLGGKDFQKLKQNVK